MPIIAALLVSLFFFMAGCLNMGIYIAQTPRDPFEPFLAGLLLQAWPLGVAAVLFMLVDIRLHQNLTAGVVETQENRNEIPESPMVHRAASAGRAEKPQEEVSYFNLNGEPLPQQPVVRQQAVAANPTQFATPPPFDHHEQTPPKAEEKPAEDKKEDPPPSGLSFFKV